MTNRETLVEALRRIAWQLRGNAAVFDDQDSGRLLAAADLLSQDGEREENEFDVLARDDEEWVYEGQMAGAAVSYAHAAFWQIAHAPMEVSVGRPHQDWRWPGEMWKPSPDPVENLKVALLLHRDPESDHLGP